MRKRYLLLGLVLCIQPALASERLDQAIEALAAIEANPTKLQSYCEIMQARAAIAVGDVVGKRMNARLDQDFSNIDSEYAEIVQATEELPEDSDDAQSLNDASDLLLDKCATYMAKLNPQWARNLQQ